MNGKISHQTCCRNTKRARGMSQRLKNCLHLIILIRSPLLVQRYFPAKQGDGCRQRQSANPPPQRSEKHDHGKATEFSLDNPAPANDLHAEFHRHPVCISCIVHSQRRTLANIVRQRPSPGLCFSFSLSRFIFLERECFASHLF